MLFICGIKGGGGGGVVRYNNWVGFAGGSTGLDDRQDEVFSMPIKDHLSVSPTPHRQTIPKVGLVSFLEGLKHHQIFICCVYRPPTTSSTSDVQ